MTPTLIVEISTMTVKKKGFIKIKEAKASGKKTIRKVASKDQVKKFLIKGLKRYKRTIKALEDK
jgi:hypothetical protein